MKSMETNKEIINLNKSEEDKGLTKWKNEPKITDLKADFEAVKSSHSAQMSKVDHWLGVYNVTGKSAIPKVKGRSSVQPQLVRKQAEWRYAPLSEPFLSTADLFRIKPVTFEDIEAAKQNELVLNNQFQTEINKVAFIDKYVRSAVDTGTVIIRTGWEVETKMVEEPAYDFEFFPIEEEDEEGMANLTEAMELGYKHPDSFEMIDPELKAAAEYSRDYGVPVYAQLTNEYTREAQRTVVNRPTLEVCDLANVYIDPTCNGDLDKANFVIYGFVTSLSELKKDGRYKNLKELEEATINNETMVVSKNAAEDIGGFRFSDKPREKITAYEYWGFWDINGDGLLAPIVATWVGDVLIRMEENPFPDQKVPFVVVPYLPLRDSIYGEPDCVLLEDNQRIVGALTRGMVDLLGRSANSQTGMAKNMLDSSNKVRFHSGQDYEFNQQIDPHSGVYQHRYPEIPQSALVMLNMMYQDAESLTGVKAFSTGGGITGAGMGQTAAGVRGALDAASKRELAILRRFAEGITKVGRKIISMNASFLDEREVVRLTNSTFIEVRRDDLNGKFDLELSITTAEEDESKAQQLAFMLQTASGEDPSLRKMILSEIARLRKMPELAQKIIDFNPEPDEMQQQLQQLQMQKLEAEIQLLQAQAQEASAGGALKGAKIEVESSRSSMLQNKADRDTLNYVEQEGGITHNRKVELETIKRDANKELSDNAHMTSLLKERMRQVMPK